MILMGGGGGGGTKDCNFWTATLSLILHGLFSGESKRMRLCEGKEEEEGEEEEEGKEEMVMLMKELQLPKEFQVPEEIFPLCHKKCLIIALSL